MLLVLCTCLGFVGALAETNERLNNYLNSVYHSYNGTSAAAYIATSTKVCAYGEAGFAHFYETGPKFEIDNRLHMGSNTKSMTATLIGILLENNLIVGQGSKGWSATLKDVYPEYAIGTPYENVSLAALSSHFGGFPANVKNYWDYYDSSLSLRVQRDNIVKTAFQMTPAVPPDTKYLYSNIGMIILGHIAEKSLSVDWEDALLQYIIDPLHMRASSSIYPFTAKGVYNWGHVALGDENIPCDGDNPPNIFTKLYDDDWACDNSPVLGPAGTYSGNILDTAKYYQWVIQCVNGVDTQDSVALSQQGCEELQSPYGLMDDTNYYGHGWIINYFNSSTTRRKWNENVSANTVIKQLSHTGSNNLNIAKVYVIPQYDVIYWGGTNSGRPSDNDMIIAVTSELASSYYNTCV